MLDLAALNRIYYDLKALQMLTKTEISYVNYEYQIPLNKYSKNLKREGGRKWKGETGRKRIQDLENIKNQLLICIQQAISMD